MRYFLLLISVILFQYKVFSQLTIDAGKDTTFCTDVGQSEHFIGSQLKITGGKPPYKYSWSLNYNLLGIWNFTAKDFLTDTTIQNPAFKNINSVSEWITITIQVTDSSGAKAEDRIRVRFSSFAYSLIDNVQYINKGDSLQFSHYFGVGAIEPLSFVGWTPGKYLSDSLSLNTWCKPEKSQHYTAIVKDSAGCITSFEGYNIRVSDIKTGMVLSEETDNNSCKLLLERYTNESYAGDVNVLIFTSEGKQIFSGNRKEETEKFFTEKPAGNQLYILELNAGNDH